VREMNMRVGDSEREPSPSEWRFRHEELPPELRAEINSLYKVRPWANFILLLYPAAWILSIAIMQRYPFWPVRAVGIVVIAISVQAMGTLMHEALHGNLFRDPFFDRWVGFALGVPTFFSSAAYKVTHLNHHRHTRSEKDMDEFSYSCRTRRQYLALFYASFLVGSLLYMCAVPVKAYAMASLKNRRRIVAEYSLMFLAYATAVSYATIMRHTEWLRWYWLAPIAVAVVLSNIRALAEHMGTSGEGDAILKTRTVTSNPLVSFLMLNLNYHLEHHLFPAIPWYNLPRVHQLLKPMYKARGAVVRKSYAAFVIECFRQAPKAVHTFPPSNAEIRPTA
jgi:fatty acid desaturase